MLAAPHTETHESTTLIVGAGPAGLAAAGALWKLGQPFTILEKAGQVGDRWRNHYDRLHLHTIKSLSALPHLPFPKDVPRYPSKAQVVQYLDAYAAAFEIQPIFGAEVTRIYRQDERWICETLRGEYSATNLVLATGYNRVPKIPEWSGQESFTGTRMHSVDYRNAEPFAGQSVLVVGSGNTGAEIALDLCEHDVRVWLSVRSPVNVVARDPFGIPAQVNGLALEHLPAWVADQLGRFAQWMQYGDLGQYGLTASKVGAATRLLREGRVALIDVGTMEMIKEGRMRVVPGIQSFSLSGVQLTDGLELEVDAVILATGYRAAIEEVFKEAKEILNDRGIPRTHGGESTLPGVFFVGFRNALSGQLRNINLDAKRAAREIAQRSRRLTGAQT